MRSPLLTKHPRGTGTLKRTRECHNDLMLRPPSCTNYFIAQMAAIVTILISVAGKLSTKAAVARSATHQSSTVFSALRAYAASRQNPLLFGLVLVLALVEPGTNIVRLSNDLTNALTNQILPTLVPVCDPDDNVHT